MRALIYGHAPLGLNGELVAVEVDLRNGLPGVDIVGLPDDAVRESRERVRAAIRNSDYEFPRGRVLVNLSPAGLRKVGAAYDLPLALAILVASAQAPPLEQPLLVAGELTLAGAVLPVHGILAAVAAGSRGGIDRFIVPAANRGEACALGAGVVAGVRSLDAAVRVLRNRGEPAPAAGAGDEPAEEPGGQPAGQTPARQSAAAAAPSAPAAQPDQSTSPWRDELGEVTDLRGHSVLKRALAVAAAGGHHLLLFGPPGSGKTMAGRRLVGLLPPLPRSDALVVTQVHSLAGRLPGADGLVCWPPFRAPHHSASAEGIVGGGRTPRPGEISLAHAGVLLLDEAPEFARNVLQSLRQPLETGAVEVVRAGGRSAHYPSAFQLIMTANPCPCGNLGRPTAACVCAAAEIKHYWKRLGGALLDRVDLRVPVGPVEPEQLLAPATDEPDDYVVPVHAAVQRQRRRYRDQPWVCNGRLPPRAVTQFCRLDAASVELLTAGLRHTRLSSRAMHAVAKVARTIADLDGADHICAAHVGEAFQYRRYGDADIYWTYE